MRRTLAAFAPIAALSAALAVTGCASSNQTAGAWHRANTPPSQIALDATACEGRVNEVAASSSQAGRDQLDSVMRGCMAAKGYSLR